MKLTERKTELQKVMRVLDQVGVQYVRASVEAVDKEKGKSIPTEVILVSMVFHRSSGKYLFSGPTMTPPPLPGPNHKPS